MPLPSTDPTDRPWLRPSLVAPWWEIILVSALLVGPFAWRSTWGALHESARKYIEMLLTDSRLLQTGAAESALLAGFLFYLHWRGWSPRDFRVRPSVGSSAQGFGLFVVTEVAHGVTVIGLFLLIFSLQTRYANFSSFLFKQVPHLQVHGINVSWSALIGTMILNAFFEELICMGYFFTQVAAKQGPLAALLLTVFLRMSCHTYQGPVNVVSIGVLFLVYGLWYWRTRNLWPLIFAHAVLDLFSTAAVKALFGH